MLGVGGTNDNGPGRRRGDDIAKHERQAAASKTHASNMTLTTTSSELRAEAVQAFQAISYEALPTVGARRSSPHSILALHLQERTYSTSLAVCPQKEEATHLLQVLDFRLCPCQAEQSWQSSTNIMGLSDARTTLLQEHAKLRPPRERM